MPQELEAKFRVASHEDVRDRLRNLGASFVGCVLETNHILDTPDGSLKRQGCGLRVRIAVPIPIGNDATDPRNPDSIITPPPATLTFKGPRDPGPLKSREEIETQIADGPATLDLLRRLGFQTVLCYQKRRESWILHDCRVELDTPPHIGLFVEIEGPSENAIRAVQRRLNLAESDLVQTSYVRMLAEYCAINGASPLVLDLSS